MITVTTEERLEQLNAEHGGIIDKYQQAQADLAAVTAELGNVETRRAQLLQADDLDDDALRELRAQRETLAERRDQLSDRVAALHARGAAAETRLVHYHDARQKAELREDVDVYERDLQAANAELIADIKRIHAELPDDVRLQVATWTWLFGGETAARYITAIHLLKKREDLLRARGAHVTGAQPYSEGIVRLMVARGELA